MDRRFARGNGALVGRRGILPSLGAGTSLIVAGALCLLVVSGWVAFRGFPGLGLDGSAPPLQMARPVADPLSDRTPAIVLGAGGPTLPAARVAPRARGTASVQRVRVGTVRTGVVAPAPTPAPSPAPVIGSDPAPSSPAPAPGPATEVERTTPPAAPERPVRQTVDRVRDLVAPVTPTPPSAVQPVVDQVNGAVDQTVDAVDQTVGAVDQTVGAVLPQPGG
jgi:hypothetical protein